LLQSELVFRRGAPPEATYTFKHALVQDAAYQSLLKSKRQQLHADVAAALERRPQVVEAEPEVLAHHLAEAGFAARAIPYWQRAARRALSRSGEREAIEHLQHALGQLPAVPETTTREQFEFELSAALGRALSTVRGFTATETGRAFEHAAELGRRLDVGPRLFPVMWGLSVFHQSAGRLAEAGQIARELLHLARRHGDLGHRLTAERVVANNDVFLGRFTSSRRHAERALALYDPDLHRELATDYAYDQRVVARDVLTFALFALGYPIQTEMQIGKALAEARSLNHRASLAHALTYGCFHHHWRSAVAGVLKHAAEVERLAGEQAIPVWLGHATVLKGWAIGRQAAEKGIAEALRGLKMLDAIGVYLFRPYLLGVLADTEAGAQQHHQALLHLDKAIRWGRQGGDRWYEAELLRRKGDILGALPGPALMEAEDNLCMAIEVAREQEARMWELRAATSLARLWRGRGKRTQARDLLARVYGWFTEGFDTADLKDAKALLDELA
jgi:predicted ATPase